MSATRAVLMVTVRGRRVAGRCSPSMCHIGTTMVGLLDLRQVLLGTDGDGRPSWDMPGAGECSQTLLP